MRSLHVLAERGYSGGEVQLEHLVRHLHAQGHRNALVLAPGARFRRVADELDLPVFEVDLRRPWSLSVRRGLREAVGSQQPDVLHFGCGRSLLWAGWLCRNMEVGLKVTTRRIDYPIRNSPWRGGRYRSLVDHVVANCESVRQRVLAVGVPPARVTLVHEGIALEPWQGALDDRGPARERLAIEPDRIVLSCAASLRPRKGQHILLEAFANLVPDWPTLQLWLAGEGTEAESLRRQAERLGVASAVRIPGAVKPVRDLYAASDVFCMPSFHEGLSNACLEASAAGLPLCVSAVGGLPEIVRDGETGHVVPPGAVPELTSALASLVGDPAARAAYGAAGAERTARLFTSQRMAEGMEELFQRLLSGRGA